MDDSPFRLGSDRIQLHSIAIARIDPIGEIEPARSSRAAGSTGGDSTSSLAAAHRRTIRQ
jgi:hypothetical protein